MVTSLTVWLPLLTGFLAVFLGLTVYFRIRAISRRTSLFPGYRDRAGSFRRSRRGSGVSVGFTHSTMLADSWPMVGIMSSSSEPETPPEEMADDDAALFWADQFFRRGMVYPQALTLAFLPGCDRHAVREALDRGCDPETAFLIFS